MHQWGSDFGSQPFAATQPTGDVIDLMMLQIGDQFDHFQINAHLAQGGMSDIYTARDLLTGNEVVLKIPNQMVSHDPALRERFQRELQVMKILNHPAVQKGLGSGHFNRMPYLVTELVEGRSLRDWITHEAPIPPEQALLIFKKAAEGIAYCHDHEVVHRDLKPENILVTRSGQPVILDFGLALTREGRRVTFANVTATPGTPDYMAPEQIEGQRGDPRTDQYALGTILYEMLSGKTPFTGDNPMAVLSQHLAGVLPRLDKEAPGISPQLAAVVAKSLQKNPDDRYATVRDFIQALDHPEQADLSLLKESSPEGTGIPFFRSPIFMVTAAGLIILLAVIVVIVVLSQTARVP